MSYRSINKYPFTPRSTLLLTSFGYTLPLGLIVDANLYPKCRNTPPFFISSIKKGNNFADMQVSSASEGNIFYIRFSLVTDDKNYVIGAGIQNGEYCGCCLCTKDMRDFIQAVPTISNIPESSLTLSGDTIKAIDVDYNENKGSLLYNDNQVSSITWGDKLKDGKLNINVIDTENGKDIEITELTINGTKVKGPNVYITPSKQSAIRVITTADIRIGRLSDL